MVTLDVIMKSVGVVSVLRYQLVFNYNSLIWSLMFGDEPMSSAVNREEAKAYLW